MNRRSPQRSALSAPQNFISEHRLGRLYRQSKPLLWSAAVIAVLGTGSILTLERYGSLAPDRDVRTPSRTEEMPLQDLVQRERDLIAKLKQLEAPSPAESAETKEAKASQSEDSANRALSKLPETAKPAPAQDDVTASVRPKPPVVEAPQEVPQPVSGVSNAGSTIERADRYLSRGQYVIARYLYEEAYRAGEILGAVGMAKSYDVTYLRSIGLQGKGDPQRSRIWYRRAAQLSSRLSKDRP